MRTISDVTVDMLILTHKHTHRLRGIKDSGTNLPGMSKFCMHDGFASLL